MNANQEARRLLHFEWKRYWPDMIISCLSAFFLGLLAVMPLIGQTDHGPFLFQMSIVEADNPVERHVTGLFLDIIFLGLFPLFVLVLTTRMPVSLVKTWEIYAQRLAVARTMPLSTRGFVRARTFQGITMVLLHFVVFFGTIYLVSQAAFVTLPFFTYLSFIAIWLGYSLAVGGWFIFMEWVSGKRSLFVHLGLYLAFVIGLIVFDMWRMLSQMNSSLVDQTIRLVNQYPWISPLTLLFGCLVLFGWSLLIEKRLQTRELY
ncbi:hypothetical protein [Desmospora activa]|uniref:ABC-2 type transport system permease protein n=1 Tax=Desmospora activa DSM 45169 TaxID=1121389 RepID=A0A2T4Z4U7_9BACL|nr:hypothetical protein [Desmospora activa]PTM56921.1 hypothetical protein C8J48_3249 [Desmospora activa DSM 45169]